jgi:hypothetical protein
MFIDVSQKPDLRHECINSADFTIMLLYTLHCIGHVLQWASDKNKKEKAGTDKAE